MKRRDCTLALAVTTIGLSGCFEAPDDETFADTVTLDDVEVRVFHVIEDAPAVNVSIGNTQLDTIRYRDAVIREMEAGRHELSVEGIVGLETTQVLLESATVEFEEGNVYDVLVSGRLADDVLEVSVLSQDDEPFPPEEDDEDEDDDEEDEDQDEDDEDSPDPVRARAAHLAEGAGAFDLFLTAQNDSLDEPRATLDFTEGSEAIEVEPGLFRVRLTEPGNADNVIYDSGDDTLVTFAEGRDLLLGIAPNTGVDADSPVSLLFWDRKKVDEFFHKDQRGGFQYVHNAISESDHPIDIIAQGGDGAEALGFTDADPGTGVGDYDLALRSARDVEITNDNGVDLKRNLKIDRGRSRTVMLIGDNNSGVDLEILSFRNEDRRVHTNAQLRMVHGAATMGDVDVYLLPEGETIAGDGVMADPLLSGFEYRKRSDYQPIVEGSYELVVTEAGNSTNRFIEDTLELSTGGIYRIIATDSEDEDNRLFLGDNPLP